MKQLTCTILVFLLLCSVVKAEEPALKSEYSYRRYTTQDGLPSASVGQLFQDSHGFLWISSGVGIIRFDGFEFKTFLKGRLANIFFINENQHGDIQAFTNNIRYTVNSKADQLRIDTLAEKTHITLNSMRLPNGYGVFYTESSSGGGQHFYQITDEGKIAKYLDNKLLNDFDYDTDLNFYFDAGKKQLYIPYPSGIIVIDEDKKVAEYKGISAYGFFVWQNEICCVTTKGIYRLSNGSAKLLIAQKLNIRATAQIGKDGSLLFGDAENIYRWKDNTLEKVFTNADISDFLVDREGNLWVATSNGLYNLFLLQFKNYSLVNQKDKITAALYYPENNEILAGTLDGNLFSIQHDKITPLTFPKREDAKFGQHCGFFGTVADGKAFLPATCDVLQRNKQNIKWLNINPNIKNDDYTPYYHISNLPDGNLAAGTQTNIQIITPEGKILKNYEKIAFFRQALFSNAVADRQGNIWYGGYYGIGILNRTTDSIEKTFFAPQFSLCVNVTADREGNVWFSSENRLFKQNADSVQLIKTFDNLILNFYFTTKKRVIVATLDGIYIFDKDLEKFSFYNHKNGFTGMETLNGTIAEDSEGNIWLPAEMALVRFNPETLISGNQSPKLHLLSSSISKDNVKWQRNNDSQNLQLNYNQNNIRFSFIGLNFSAADNVRYHYRLLGFQNNWSEPTKQREITFNNLPPGDYTFEIYADAGTDESRCETQSFAFSITPAFWQTTWFMIACIAFLMLGSAGIALVIQIRKNRALLEKLRTEKELNELRISSIRLKAIPHFNANVLAAIEYYISNRTKEEAIRILGIYSDFTYKTLSDVDKAARPLSEELAYVKMYLDLEKIRFIEKFDFSIKVDDDVDKSVQLPNMILHTYCENAVKHGLMPLQSGGLLSIHVSQHNQIVCVSVEDNGVGRAQAANNQNIRSSKQGLSILNRQIEIYNRFNRDKINQQVEDLQQDGKPSGTLFTVEIPLEFTYIN